ncbi:hypothetical protein [Amycolatopsis albispora]|uniref:Uncharacterized protein n=1 Tax=Amycolatopsis albispora TaxID=1804986 RepID=A0A344LE19_9PSEU|nr:hypothetical protein [Amycolatopsis albispora]AXB46293.1 hypothetical protein A4R43_30725 [Amycolatopsis albispora]
MPVPTPGGFVFDRHGGSLTTDKTSTNDDADARREQWSNGAGAAAQEAAAWTTFGNELAELGSKLQACPAFGPLSGLTNLPEVEPGVFGYGTEVPRHGVNGEEMIGHLTALMRDSRAIGAAYEAAGHRLAAAVTEPAA